MSNQPTLRTRTTDCRLVWVGLLAATALAMAGCDSSHQLTGTVTFEGKPVPAGRVVFVPDAQQGNSGGGASGEISDGKYTAQLLQDGAYIVTIRGHDGVPQQGAPGMDLFSPIDQKVTITAETTTLDFALPAED